MLSDSQQSELKAEELPNHLNSQFDGTEHGKSDNRPGQKAGDTNIPKDYFQSLLESV